MEPAAEHIGVTEEITRHRRSGRSTSVEPRGSGTGWNTTGAVPSLRDALSKKIMCRAKQAARDAGSGTEG